MSSDQVSKLSDVQDAHARALLNFRNHLIEKYELVRASIDATIVLLPPLVAIVTGYATVDPCIADVLREYTQRAMIDVNRKLVWRVKHRDDPAGPDVAEVSIGRYHNTSQHNIPNCIPYVTTMFRIDRHDGETCFHYAYILTYESLCSERIESDGITIRLNKREAEFSMAVANDIHAIVLTGLHQMIDQ